MSALPRNAADRALALGTSTLYEASALPVFSRGISVRGTVKASAPSVGKPIWPRGT
jgi:hypothetical protein